MATTNSTAPADVSNDTAAFQARVILWLEITSAVLSFFGGCLTVWKLIKLDVSKRGQFRIVASLMITFNTCSIVLQVLNNVQETEDNCLWINQFINVISPLFFISFDSFILYKSYVICNSKSWVKVVCVLLVIDRAVWAIADGILSGGYWDAVNGDCGYSQNGISGIGYNVADMLCDIFCTMLNVSYWWTVSLDLVKENTVRSIIVVAVNAFAIYGSQNFDDYFELSLMYSLQNLMFVLALNVEHLWMYVRQAKSHSHKIQVSDGMERRPTYELTTAK